MKVPTYITLTVHRSVVSQVLSEFIDKFDSPISFILLIHRVKG